METNNLNRKVMMGKEEKKSLLEMDLESPAQNDKFYQKAKRQDDLYDKYKL